MSRSSEAPPPITPAIHASARRSRLRASLARRLRRGAARPLGLIAVLVSTACAGAGSASDVTLTAAAPSAPPAVSASATPPGSPSPSPSPASAPKLYDPDLHQLVSKQYTLPADYVPADLVSLPAAWAVPAFAPPVVRRVAAGPLEALLRAAHADGVDLRVRSSYRSYETQRTTFAFWVQTLGEAQARRESAEPGHSEHQLGTTVDFASAAVGWELIAEFGDTPEGQWVAAHAWQYGFAMSYPHGEEEVTGYVYEPWHFRYIGRRVAAAWRAADMTLIEFLVALHRDAGVPVSAPTSAGSEAPPAPVSVTPTPTPTAR